jgi:dihydrolipoamide dehydrogenase
VCITVLVRTSHLVELLDRIVPLEDADVSKELQRAFKKQGMKVETGLKLDKMEKGKNGVKVSGQERKRRHRHTRSRDAPRRRRPHGLSRGLGLENTKVKVSPKGTIEANEYCETAEPGIYAIGDVYPDRAACPPRFKERHPGR